MPCADDTGCNMEVQSSQSILAIIITVPARIETNFVADQTRAILLERPYRWSHPFY